MSRDAHLAGQTIRGLIAGAAARGLDPLALQAAAGISDALLADPDARVPIRVANKLFDEAVRVSGDEDLGFHLAELAAFVPHDGLHYVGKSCAKLRDAYRVATRYSRLVNSHIEIALIEEGGLARLVHRALLAPELTRRVGVDCALALLLLRPRTLMETHYRPREVHLRYPRPAQTSEHARIFEAPVIFDAPENELVFDAAVLELPLRQHDPRLVAVLERHIAVELAKLPPADTVVERARRAIADAISGEEVTIEDIAGRLRLSPRSLQRKLNEEGTSFSELVRTIRRELAASYLRNLQVPIGEVAFLLGFAEVSSFHRAFKSWFGMTPHEFRQGRAPAPA